MITTFLKYFKNIRFQKIILWCYLVWYLTIMSLYFEASLKLWASSVGTSLVIGFALLLSTSQKGVKQNFWAKFRLFMFPFCISSYSATIKDYDFIVLFPSDLLHLSISVLNCLLFLSLVWCVKTFYKRNIKKA